LDGLHFGVDKFFCPFEIVDYKLERFVEGFLVDLCANFRVEFVPFKTGFLKLFDLLGEDLNAVLGHVGAVLLFVICEAPVAFLYSEARLVLVVGQLVSR